MRNIVRASIVSTIALLLATTFQIPAHAATTWTYQTSAGGTYVQLASGLVTSDMTSKSGMFGTKVPNSAQNSVASATAGGLVAAGAITTSHTATGVTGGVQVNSVAKTAGASVLNGLIKADALTTTTTTVLKSDGTSSSVGHTDFAGLKIAGVNLPLNIPRNYVVSVPGVATIALNYFTTGVDADGNRFSINAAVSVVLLKPQGNVPAGARISINPTFHAGAPTIPDAAARLGGQAYGTSILANVSDEVKVESPATARVVTASGGTGGQPAYNTTAGLNLPGILVLGAVKSTSVSSRFGTGSRDGDVRTSNEVAGVNVLGGLVEVEALKVQAHERRVGTTPCAGDMSFSVAKLTVAGKPIPVTAAPNTVVDVPGVAKVTLNEQHKSACGTRVRGVVVTLLRPIGDLPVGAVVEVGYASALIG